MDVINFSGGGPETEPANDAMIETIANVAAAGVVPVISAGNDRDEFGFGTAARPAPRPTRSRSPRSATPGLRARHPARRRDAGLSGSHRPSAGERLAGRSACSSTWRPSRGRTGGRSTPSSAARPPTRTDADAPARVAARRHRARPARTCRSSPRPEGDAPPARRDLFVDNRPGRRTPSRPSSCSSGMIADVDGARLRTEFLRAGGGRGEITITRTIERIDVDRGGTITSFSSAGPTAFGHRAEAGRLRARRADPVVDAAASRRPVRRLRRDEHGGAARHRRGGAPPPPPPQLDAAEVKSALVSSAEPGLGGHGRAVRGAGDARGRRPRRRARAPTTRGSSPRPHRSRSATSSGRRHRGDARADRRRRRGRRARGRSRCVRRPRRPAPPSSRPRRHRARRRRRLPHRRGARPPPRRPERTTASSPCATAPTAGGSPTSSWSSRPALAALKAQPLRLFQAGTTATGTSLVAAYRYPTAVRPGSRLRRPRDATGRGRSGSTPSGSASRRELRRSRRGRRRAARSSIRVVLGSKDENDVQGAAGTPVNVNPLTFDYRADIGTAGAAPRAKTYYVAVDSGRDAFTGPARRPLPAPVVGGRRLPAARRSSRRASRPAGRRSSSAWWTARSRAGERRQPALAHDRLRPDARRGRAYDPVSGIAVFPLPREAPMLGAGRGTDRSLVSDLQESKNLNTSGADIMPNTNFSSFPLRVVRRPTATRIRRKRASVCPGRRLSRSSRARPRGSQRVVLRGKRLATDRTSPGDLYSGTWKVGGLRKGRHKLRAVVVDARAARAAAERCAPLRPVAARCTPVAGARRGRCGHGHVVGDRRGDRHAPRGCGVADRPSARRRERLEALAEAVGGEVEVADVADRDAVERAGEAILERLPAVSLLVNNAGIPGRADFETADPQRIEDVLRVNYLGSVWWLRALLPGLERARPGHVVNVVSVAGTVAMPASGPYAASKHAQLAFSRATAASLRRRGSGCTPSTRASSRRRLHPAAAARAPGAAPCRARAGRRGPARGGAARRRDVRVVRPRLVSDLRPRAGARADDLRPGHGAGAATPLANDAT